MLVHTPRDENFEMVLFEAMEAGVPVAAASSGGPCESVVHRQIGLPYHDSFDVFAHAILTHVNDQLIAV